MEFKDLRQKLEEAASVGEISPAAMLVLRRRGIRVFPDGQRVALYTNEKYNLTFMVPFGGQHPASAANPLMPVHEEQLDEYVNVMGGLASAAAGLVKSIAKAPAARAKAAAETAKKEQEKRSAAHRANREKQLKRGLQNRQKRQHAELVAALKNRQGNTP
jgi:hypothetical protein